ncbi:MAG: peptidoglycan DD-metalloendopeptidase family protein [bacterium]
MENKNKTKRSVIWSLAILVVAGFLFLPQTGQSQDSFGASDDSEEVNVLDINQKIKESKSRVKDLTEELEKNQKELAKQQSQAASLENQLAILDTKITKNELDLQVTQERIKGLAAELEKIEYTIKQKEEEIDNQMQQLVELIKLIYKLDQKSYLEVLVLNDSFSEFFNQMQFTNQVQDNLRESVDQLKKIKQELDMQQSGMELKKSELDDLKATLQAQMDSLDEQQTTKESLLDETRDSEKRYESLVSKLKLEQRQIDADIARMEQAVRKKLLGNNDKSLPGVVSLAWPINPARGISAYFHDPDYPYRYIFEHPAIDIRASQGTPIKAAESGYVGRVKFDGNGNYAYIQLIHGDGLSTVYGHTSRVDVNQDDYVVKGQVIGAVGGMPGTVGAGRLTTGPHLHFEVRKDGIPVNALEYLP